MSLIVPTRDRFDLLSQCVESIREKTLYPHYEIVIVDNQSTDRKTLDYMARLEGEGRARVLRYDHPFNYSAINNFAVAETASEIVGLVNNDIEALAPEWLDEMVGHARRPAIGCVGARLLYPDRTLQHGGIFLGYHGVAAAHMHRHLPESSPGYLGRALLTQNLSAVTAACLLVRRKVFDEVGGLDAENLHVSFNDVDFCLRVREAGYRNLWTPYAELFHHESATRGPNTTPLALRERDYLKQRWGRKLLEDPAYNPNLSVDAEDCPVAWPPRAPRPWRKTGS